MTIKLHKTLKTGLPIFKHNVFCTNLHIHVLVQPGEKKMHSLCDYTCIKSMYFKENFTKTLQMNYSQNLLFYFNTRIIQKSFTYL